MRKFNIGLVAASTLVLMGAGQGLAQSDYFDGQNIDFVVATDAGGGYDTYGRLVAEFMQQYLPGSTIVVRNMPGAGHMIGANYIYSSEPDGLTIGTFNTGLIYSQVIGTEGVQFDLADMSWIGKMASDGRAIVVSEESGIEDWQDLVDSQENVRFAAAGVASASTAETTMLINALDLPIDLITGYNGEDGELAMMRGEVQGQLGSRSSLQAFVDNGNGQFVVQIGGPEEDVPQLADLVEDEAARRVVSLVQAQAEIGRMLAGPPGIPEEPLAALREAFEMAVNDPDFLERAEELGLPIDPLVGEDVAEVVRAALDQDEATVEFLQEMMGE